MGGVSSARNNGTIMLIVLVVVALRMAYNSGINAVSNNQFVIRADVVPRYI